MPPHGTTGDGRTPGVAVVGAGVTGLTCAATLAAQGLTPMVLERSRGPGGRVATRQRDGLQFDHGAQTLWVDDADPLIASAREAGHAALWPAAAQEGGRVPWVGMARMKDILAPLTPGLRISYNTEVKEVSRISGGWRVTTDAMTETFDAVVLAAPAPQILRVLDRSEADLRAKLESVRFAPCHALMVAFDGPADWPDMLHDPPAPFTLVLRDSSKPGRRGSAECYVAHTTEAWSAEHLDAGPDEIAEALLSALGESLGPLPPVRLAMGHRWRFAQASLPLGASFAGSDDGTLLAGGDWALGRNVEHALESGRAMALELIEGLAARPRACPTGKTNPNQ